MHKSTVSLALSGKGNVSAATRARVLEAARELGYEPNPLAQRLAWGHRNDLVCLFSGVLDVGLSTAKVLEIQRLLNAQGLEVPIYTCGDTPPGGASLQVRQVRQLRRNRPRAILCASQRVERAVFEELATYQREGGTVVSYDTPVPLSCDQVIFDREDNAYRAARLLIERGHRRIGLGVSSLPPDPEKADSDPIPLRTRGFLRALRDAGIPVREEWLFRNPQYERGGAQMARQFLRLADRPTALCIVNDYVAFAFMVEVLRAGLRVPEDVSVIGHDDQPIAAYCPVPLTCTTQPADRIAEEVAGMLLGRVSGRVPAGTPPRTVTIRGELVERASVAAL